MIYEPLLNSLRLWGLLLSNKATCARRTLSIFMRLPQHFIKALWCFLSTTNASQATYNGFRDACQACYPGDPFLSFDQMKHKVEMITGVVPLIYDMCINTCAAFTGPFSSLQACLLCSEPWYHLGTRDACQQFLTIPIRPIIQAFIIHQRQQKRCTIERTLLKPFSSMLNKMVVGWKNTMTRHVQGNTLMPAMQERSRMAMWQFRYLSMVLSSMQIRTRTVGYSSMWFTTSPLTYGTRNALLYLLASLVVQRSQNTQTLIFIPPSPIFLLCKRRVWRSGMHGLTHIFPSPFHFLCWLLPMGLPWQMHVAMLDIVENVAADYSVHFLDDVMMKTGTTSPFCKNPQIIALQDVTTLM